MNIVQVKIGVLAAAIMLSSSVKAEPSPEEFQAMLDAQKSQGASEQVEKGENKKEVSVDDIDVPALFEEIDNHQARILRLNQMVEIAELEQEYLDMTGHAPPDAVTLRSGGDSADASDELVSVLRGEINNLKQKIDGMVIRMNEEPSLSPRMKQLDRIRNMQEEFSRADTWEVKGISVYGDKRSAVISSASSNDFMVHQGQEVGGVKVVSINSGMVKVREDGETTEIPLAGTGYKEQDVDMMLPPEELMGGWDEGASDSSMLPQRNGTIDHSPVPDSTSR